MDGVTTDAASWNRNMWTQFGINEKSSSCEHPIRPDCRLYFFSDWNHILKCARNILCPELPQKPKEGTDKPKKKRPRKDAQGNELSEQQVYNSKLEKALNKEIEVRSPRQRTLVLLCEYTFM